MGKPYPKFAQEKLQHDPVDVARSKIVSDIKMILLPKVNKRKLTKEEQAVLDYLAQVKHEVWMNRQK